ncbi:MAG: hypothetical protein WBY44_32815 [Bryobacteraceae bacterium]|jgi:hypothetical protein
MAPNGYRFFLMNSPIALTSLSMPASRRSPRRSASLSKQAFEVSAAMNGAKNENVFSFDAVNDDVIAHRETAGPFPEIGIASSSGVREGGEENEAVSDPVD